jgi:hypothetical protein
MASGKKRQAAGTAKVLAENYTWSEKALAIIESYDAGVFFTSDTVRKDAILCDIGLPEHPNAWGAVLSVASKHGMIQKTGRYFSSDIDSNHSRVVAEWRKII